jgi:phosphatidylinositol alpha-1,6-mannosyltransferase
VLATLMLPNSGEGFGIVLAEAQLAGCVVVTPPLDGSSDAILPGVTGLRPIDSSASSLRDVLLWCLDQPQAAARIASNARAWSGVRFSPDRYRKEVAAVLLDGSSPPALDISMVQADGNHVLERPRERG